MTAVGYSCLRSSSSWRASVARLSSRSVRARSATHLRYMRLGYGPRVPEEELDPEPELDAEHQVTPLELFFDLVFVFALTQVTTMLAADPTWPAAQTEFFFGDERAVRPEHPDSNYRMAHETLLAPLRVDPARVHRIEAERADLDAAALAYEAELVRALGAGKDVLPRLDCVLLGMGADGHTASLFPHSAALSETRRGFVANQVPASGARRVTITFPLIERARSVLVLVCGEANAAALAEVLEGPLDPERLPAQRLRGRSGAVRWLCDASAASGLRRAEPEA